MTGSVHLRPASLLDLEALYAICLRTGDAGKDASGLYSDPRLMGHIYAAPYVALDGLICLVAEDAGGVAGYVAGAADTRDFERRLEAEWWPALRKSYAEPEGDRSAWTADEFRIWTIFHPTPIPDEIARRYPAHIHMNLLPRAQGKGIGSKLLDAWIEAAKALGVQAVHAGVSAVNQPGLTFWKSRGFRPVSVDRSAGSRGTVWCGRDL
ncbi:GNAT family N-acetyltransferase [Roseibium salinum]|uniref:GNAT family N-acetyltransferase n=1 Tax=Roseibium salinum TaxID=1604349 RepID=A0ABT3R3I1_9HYPH|nr:GNAT family N-acetyltransferase [Roseibium sp. DSM 29163]MCX2723691.1 GNAT family N-acetyltransferase [Roseibium sp. DSM 29163]